MDGIALQALIAALDTDDAQAQRRAGAALLALGTQATPALIAALASGPPRIRKAAAFLLGKSKPSADGTAALERAVVEDSEPKVRKNAAIALGTIGAPQSVPALVAALQKETVGWVRPSLVLALGAIGGPDACAALRSVAPTTAAEQEALHKALDRCAPHTPAADWRRELAWQHELQLEVPIGLEAIALEEAAERGLHEIGQAGPGCLRYQPGIPPWDLLPLLRCIYGVRICAGQAPIPPGDLQSLAAAIAALLAGSAVLRDWRRWLKTDEALLRYRFALDGIPIRRADRRTILEAVRAACRPLGLVDSPSNYDLELVVVVEAATGQLFIRPSFMRDTRFAYRQRDVGAAIDPVIAACLARLVRTPGGGTVLDPTCGSATLLIERALLGGRLRLIGLDISPTAVAAARANVKAAGLSSTITIRKADATQLEQWPPCDEVIANLPFGVRTRRREVDLNELYGAILTNLAVRLRPGGHAVLYTANRKAFEAQLRRHKHRFQLRDRLRVQAGGLWVAVWSLLRRP